MRIHALATLVAATVGALVAASARADGQPSPGVTDAARTEAAALSNVAASMAERKDFATAAQLYAQAYERDPTVLGYLYSKARAEQLAAGSTCIGPFDPASPVCPVEARCGADLDAAQKDYADLLRQAERSEPLAAKARTNLEDVQERLKLVRAVETECDRRAEQALTDQQQAHDQDVAASRVRTCASLGEAARTLEDRQREARRSLLAAQVAVERATRKIDEASPLLQEWSRRIGDIDRKLAVIVAESKAQQRPPGGDERYRELTAQRTAAERRLQEHDAVLRAAKADLASAEGVHRGSKSSLELLERQAAEIVADLGRCQDAPETARALEAAQAGSPMDAIPAGPVRLGLTHAQANDVLAVCKRQGGRCSLAALQNEISDRAVAVAAFQMERHEVTAERYRRCVDAGACTAAMFANCQFPDAGARERAIVGARNHPVVCIDRPQAGAYCRFLGRRLPTAAEWLRAARGGDERLFPWGNDSRRVAVTGRATPVGTTSWDVGPFGTRDLYGNVREWTDDGTARGDGFAGGHTGRRITIRAELPADAAVFDLGFRCAADAATGE